MQGSAARPRVTIAMIMVVIAFLAVAVVGSVASYRDRNRPDFLLAIWCAFAGWMAWTSFSRATGRDLAGAWGANLAMLGVFLAGQFWLGLVFTPLPADSPVLRLMLWNYWPALAAFPAHILGGYLARSRYDRNHADPVPPAG